MKLSEINDFIKRFFEVTGMDYSEKDIYDINVEDDMVALLFHDNYIIIPKDESQWV